MKEKTAMMLFIEWALDDQRQSVYTKRDDYINKAKSLLGVEQANIENAYAAGVVPEEGTSYVDFQASEYYKEKFESLDKYKIIK